MGGKGRKLYLNNNNNNKKKKAVAGFGPQDRLAGGITRFRSLGFLS